MYPSGLWLCICLLSVRRTPGPSTHTRCCGPRASHLRPCPGILEVASPSPASSPWDTDPSQRPTGWLWRQTPGATVVTEWVLEGAQQMEGTPIAARSTGGSDATWAPLSPTGALSSCFLAPVTLELPASQAHEMGSLFPSNVNKSADPITTSGGGQLRAWHRCCDQGVFRPSVQKSLEIYRKQGCQVSTLPAGSWLTCSGKLHVPFCRGKSLVQVGRH